MANDGPDSNGSQYCLMLSPQPHLNYLHNVFGHVVRGLDVLPQIRQGDTMHVKILRLGPAAEAFKADAATFAALVAKANRYHGPREPGPEARFDDPDKILPYIPWNRAQAFNFKLANFERFNGTRLVARVFAHRPAEAAGGRLDTWLDDAATRLGTARSGAFAVYFADEDRWYLKIGTASVSQFIRGNSAGRAPHEPQTLAGAEQEFLEMARADAAELFTTAAANATPDRPLPDGQKLKFKVDAVLDRLIFKLEPDAAAAETSNFKRQAPVPQSRDQ
jgi:hypothetical protein